MRYWFVMPWDVIHPGGVVHVVMNLYRHFINNGVDACVFVQSWDDSVLRNLIQNGINKAYLRFRNPVTNGIYGFIAFWVTLPYYILRLSVLLRQEKVDFVNPHYPNESIFVFVLLKKLKLFNGKLIISLHGSDFDVPERSLGYRKWIWKFIFHGSDAIVTCSHALSMRVTSVYPELSNIVHVVHNGFDQDKFLLSSDNSASLAPELAGKEFILTIAAFDEKKGHAVLINAFKKIIEHSPTLMLVLIGGYTPYREKLLALVNDLELSDHVIFITNLPHSQLHVYLRSAKLFVLPSLSEAFGIVILEAGAFQLPVIASRIGGIPEIITTRDTGILVTPGNTQELVAAINIIINDLTESQRIGSNLRMRTFDFLWSSASRKYLNIFHSLI